MGEPRFLAELPKWGPDKMPVWVHLSSPMWVLAESPNWAPDKMPTWVHLSSPMWVPAGSPNWAPDRMPTWVHLSSPMWVPAGSPKWAPDKMPTLGSPMWVLAGSPNWAPDKMPTWVHLSSPLWVPAGSPKWAPDKMPTLGSPMWVPAGSPKWAPDKMPTWVHLSSPLWVPAGSPKWAPDKMPTLGSPMWVLAGSPKWAPDKMPTLGSPMRRNHRLEIENSSVQSLSCSSRSTLFGNYTMSSMFGKARTCSVVTVPEHEPSEVNIVILGARGSGKSEDTYTSEEVVDQQPVLVKVMDTADQDGPMNCERYLSWANAFIVVYSINSRHSFELCLQQVSKADGAALALRFGCQFFEVSACLDFLSVKHIFHEAVREVRRETERSIRPLFISEDKSALTLSSAPPLAACIKELPTPATAKLVTVKSSRAQSKRRAPTLTLLKGFKIF
ncbi:hypothetical protein DNTS_014157 [Danionella cerebrum]|uniref:small monomeric GTPase n=1 Tax=Danionella cerebrum TaxID=2873325 RepID=A0A553RG99_9TELE|nr:hypothetical protein DNTS_014157 [Danionella translucida]